MDSRAISRMDIGLYTGRPYRACRVVTSESMHMPGLFGAFGFRTLELDPSLLSRFLFLKMLLEQAPYKTTGVGAHLVYLYMHTCVSTSFCHSVL